MDTNWNNGFGLEQPNLIIKFNKINQNEWNLIIKSHENQWNPDPNLSQIIAKFRRKSAIFEIKFRENQWNSWSIPE